MLLLYEVKGGGSYYCTKLREGVLLWYEVKGEGCYYCTKLREGGVTIVRS